MKERQLDSIIPFHNIGGNIKQTENPGCRRQPGLDGGINLTHPLDRFIEHDKSGQKGHEGTGGGMSLQHLHTTKPDNQGHGHPAQKFDHGMGQAPVAGFGHQGIEEMLNLAGKSLLFRLFHAESLDDPGPADGLMQDIGRLADAFLVAGGNLAKLFSEDDNGNNGQGQDYHGHQGQTPIHDKDDPQQADH